MSGRCEPGQMWAIVLFADESMTSDFPRELFFDPDIVWHQQQFGKNGQLATANLMVSGSTLYSMVHISDVVQRISRQREYKTRIENRFKGWSQMLMNSILNFAHERSLNVVLSPTAELALPVTHKYC